MKKDSHNLGTVGEELARKHLIKNGHQILETNWRFKKLEVDIISRSGEQIVFVEVKTRTSDLLGEPEDFVTKKKQKYLVAAAHQYLCERNIELDSRFDVIAILVKDNHFEINQLESAFRPLAQ